MNNLSDKFELRVSKRSSKKKLEKILFKDKNDNNDFRIVPTLKNSKKFANWILKNQLASPNFFDARRIHLIIKKMIVSSKKKKLIPIN